MEFYQIINYLPPYALHAVLLATVVLSAVLVFVFSFRNIGEPPFSEKKSANKKKKQPKEKKSQNGHAVTEKPVEKQTKSDAKKETPKSPTKSEKKQNEPKEKPAEKKVVKEKVNAKDKKTETTNSPKEKATKSPGKGKENVEGKNKRLIRLLPLKSKEENGGWEQAISRKERRARKALLEDPNANYNADGNVTKITEEKGSKKDKESSKSSALKGASDEANNKNNTSLDNNVVAPAPSKKNVEAKKSQSSSADEPPVGSSTVYDEFAEVFKEPSKKAIKKRVRKE
ncbi:unnamed protein product [Bemisia tabaci]|uniref:Uncharacterized protein n=1 Tax=Bemisia tabaci TaxID=7038 RepID=A0A9P0F5T5_BEMTA|nr:unnamed protein product [Bemisia tabaci]